MSGLARAAKRARARRDGGDLAVYHDARCGWYTVTCVLKVEARRKTGPYGIPTTGVLPDELGCRRPRCDGTSVRLSVPPTPWPRGVPIEPGWEWYPPDAEQIERFREAGGPSWKHIARGGLLLRRRTGKALGGEALAEPREQLAAIDAAARRLGAEGYRFGVPSEWMAARRNGKRRAADERRADMVDGPGCVLLPGQEPRPEREPIPDVNPRVRVVERPEDLQLALDTLPPGATGHDPNIVHLSSTAGVIAEAIRIPAHTHIIGPGRP